ncbi:hypothetical protein KFK09_014517 [Dendrobium nobile]|uniref:Uncharacterized protein n=1 Tax=Dendrobium nobile TaxID=94219 RepID=A0A8T3B4J3_DENNO|nr:hypothetical protein KFK09_014517 [Dendrobium nobile]
MVTFVKMENPPVVVVTADPTEEQLAVVISDSTASKEAKKFLATPSKLYLRRKAGVVEQMEKSEVDKQSR